MRLALDYLPVEDRLSLGWQDAAGEHRLWLTRRHALVLLLALDEAAAADRDGDRCASPVRHGVDGPGGVAGDTEGGVGAPVHAPVAAPSPALREALVLGVRLLRDGQRLALRTAEGTANVSLPAVAAARLRDSLRGLCERAGWDADAALLRLRSVRLAREAIERARGT